MNSEEIKTMNNLHIIYKALPNVMFFNVHV